MTYRELLLDPMWKSKRNEILIRDSLECTICKNEKLIKDSALGQLFFQGKNNNGFLYQYWGNDHSNSFTLKKVFFRNDALIKPLHSDKGIVAYIYVNTINSNDFQKVIAVREFELNDYLKRST